MAFFMGINAGASDTTITTNTSTTSKDVEVVINTNANVPSIADLMLALQRMEQFILKNGKAW